MSNCPKCNEPVKGKTKFCPSCGEKLGRMTADEKKARLTEEKKGGKAPFIIIGALVLAGAVAFGVLSSMDTSSTKISGGSSASGGDTKNLTFPVSTFDDGQPKYYSYKGSGGRDVKFFVLKSSDGVIRAAFDACDVCYQSKKGYRQDGDFMVCNNCGQRFTSVRINEVKGGCNPAPLKR
ncbi:Fe-S-containing protein [Candidatus Moduliflexota bacterium]